MSCLSTNPQETSQSTQAQGMKQKDPPSCVSIRRSMFTKYALLKCLWMSKCDYFCQQLNVDEVRCLLFSELYCVKYMIGSNYYSSTIHTYPYLHFQCGTSLKVDVPSKSNIISCLLIPIRYGS